MYGLSLEKKFKQLRNRYSKNVTSEAEQRDLKEVRGTHEWNFQPSNDTYLTCCIMMKYHNEL